MFRMAQLRPSANCRPRERFRVARQQPDGGTWWSALEICLVASACYLSNLSAVDNVFKSTKMTERTSYVPFGNLMPPRGLLISNDLPVLAHSLLLPLRRAVKRTVAAGRSPCFAEGSHLVSVHIARVSACRRSDLATLSAPLTSSAVEKRSRDVLSSLCPSLPRSLSVILPFLPFPR